MPEMIASCYPETTPCRLVDDLRTHMIIILTVSFTECPNGLMTNDEWTNVWSNGLSKWLNKRIKDRINNELIRKIRVIKHSPSSPHAQRLTSFVSWLWGTPEREGLWRVFGKACRRRRTGGRERWGIRRKTRWANYSALRASPVPNKSDIKRVEHGYKHNVS